MQNKPLVSLIVVVRNEEKFIVGALRSLVTQSYPKELVQIILVDGLSNDNTRSVAETFLKSAGVDYVILTNEKKILASGWNLAIKAAKGEYVCRIDAHGAISQDYVERGIDNLLTGNCPGLVCTGGQLVNKGEGFWGGIAQDFFSSKFGIGNSPFRIKSTQKFYSDTAAMGMYCKSIFEEVGYFDEQLARNQDIALHKKILAKGYKFITDPDMIFTYYVRSNFRSFIKKAYQDGFWIIYSEASYLRHKVPLFFFLYLLLICSLKLLKRLNWLVLYPLVSYAILSCFYACKDGRGLSKVFLVLVYPAYHLAYGFGSFVAFLKKFHGSKTF